jgi:hypothetical protein
MLLVNIHENKAIPCDLKKAINIYITRWVKLNDLKTRYWRRLYRLTIKKLSCCLQIKNASFL